MITTTVKRNRWNYTLETPEGDYKFIKLTHEVFHDDLQMSCPKCDNITFSEFCGSVICLSCLSVLEPTDLVASVDQSW